MITIQGESNTVKISKDILIGSCLLFDNDDHFDQIRLPFGPRALNNTVRILEQLHQEPLDRVEIRQFITTRKTNNGIWMYSFDLRAAIGSVLYELVKDPAVALELVRVQHYLNSPCLRVVTSAAYIYHQLRKKDNYVF